MRKNIQRINLDPSFGKAAPKTEVRAHWVRTDWDSTAAIGVGICSAAFMIACFYFIF